MTRSYAQKKLMAVSLAAILTFLAAGCSGSSEPLVVWSNVADTAFFLELYTRETGQPVHYRHIENLTEALTQQRVDADLVIGRWVNNPPANSVMRSGNDRNPWTPVAFNLGAIVFDRDHTRLDPAFAVTPDDIGANLRPRDSRSGEDREPMRFLPSLDPRFLYEMLRIGGVRPRPGPAGEGQWDASGYDDAFRVIREWQTRWNESKEAERNYREQYLHDPWYRLLENRRVLAVYLPSDELLDWTFLGRSTFDFRWLRDTDQSIPVLEDVVYAGIPDVSSARVRDARNLLEWLTDTGNQIQFVEYKFDQRIDTFGVYGGFSTSAEVNHMMVERVYPELVGRIPDPDTLRFPGVRPRYWDEALATVVRPFAGRAAGSPAPDEDRHGRNLVEALQRWYNQRGD